MRHYELVVVLSPMLNPAEVTETWDRIKGFITTREAEISHEEQWGTRRLAYPIRKGQNQFLEGSYHLTRFATEQPFNRELETFLKVDDEVIRSMVTVTLPEEELAAQAAAAARAIRPPPPPRPAPIGPDGAPMAPAPAAAPAAVAEAPTAGAAPQAPEATAEGETAVAEAEPEPANAEESEPAASEDSGGPDVESAEEPEAPATDPDESEE
ncbi:MAG: 30S ribosomal protein S6 [SAR202 cluster bacterium Io17-Chloro-G6]|nr:MAG: 30S ribosomal protein S6 [SAR202 cluster bacterium Io17-Chloro-G6]